MVFVLFLCIDLKSFFASVECVERGLDPMKVNLVVADMTRTEKTICLAVSPAMKKQGVKNRCRVFEIPKNVKYITAPPRMSVYIEYASKIYSIYLKYFSREDIHVYSIDEVFIDMTNYMSLYKLEPRELVRVIVDDVLETTGITASAGIGTNLYLAKIAMDIMAKHSEDNIAFLDEELYRLKLWRHMPLTDFWRIGHGTVRRLAKYGICTMEHIAHADENLLYNVFGIDAELLIDHAWGRESVDISDIKTYEPKSTSISSGQVLSCDYNHEKGRLIVKEMADLMCLELVDKEMATNSITLQLGYSNALNMEPARGSILLDTVTSQASVILPRMEELYNRIKDKNLPIRRVNISFNNLVDDAYRQYDLFTDPMVLEKEKKLQKAMIALKRKYGKNSVLKGMNLEEGAKTMERNNQIGGHSSGREL